LDENETRLIQEEEKGRQTPDCGGADVQPKVKGRS